MKWPGLITRSFRALVPLETLATLNSQQSFILEIIIISI